MRRKPRYYRAYDTEWEVVTLRSRKNGYKNISEYTREMLLNGPIKKFDMSSLHELHLELEKIGKVINQIAHECNEKQSVTDEQVEELTRQVEKIKIAINKYMKPLEYTLIEEDDKT